MEVAISGSAIDCYEDMFKEITRKLYGEDGLTELGPNDRLQTTHERTFPSIDYEIDNSVLKQEEHLTAFGLAALMQNGFPPNGILNSTFPQHKPSTPSLEDKWITNEDNLQWTQSKIAAFNPVQKLFKCFECDCVGYLQSVAEHWLGTHSNVRSFHCTHCPYESAWARCVRMHLNRQHNINTDGKSDTILKNNPILQEISKYLQRLKTKLEGNCTKSQQQSSQMSEDYQSTSNSSSRLSQQISSISNEHTNNPTKRYSCTYCPYATDRRDLFTRHENIHREEKPFQCYVCQKQFNRADHVKKHFLRMHREHPYDLNRIRKQPPKNSSGISYYQKYNNCNGNNQQDNPNSLSNLHSLSVPCGFNMNKNVSSTRLENNEVKSALPTTKNGTLSKSSSKKKGEKRFNCCYCSWSGVDNWCLKRHMNTHLKPFVCGLCDYKAARSERLATHVLKVHNKRACGKCNFLADDLIQLTAHQQEDHPLEQRKLSNNSALPNTTCNTLLPSVPTCNQNQKCGNPKNCDLSLATAALLQQNSQSITHEKSWKSHHTPKQHGAARLFSYMEASDGSEPESDTRQPEDVSRVNLSHRMQSDFPEAGDAGSQVGEDDGDEMELPLFVCRSCGCEFEDDISLEIHQHMHRHSAASPAKPEDSKENVNPKLKYRCCLCSVIFESQQAAMKHMMSHSSLTSGTVGKKSSKSRIRKQSKPRKLLIPYWDHEEVQVLRQLNTKLSKWRRTPIFSTVKLSDKYMAHLVTRRGYTCIWCKKSCLSRFHNKGSLVLHQYWKHSNKQAFKCEHCNKHFRHRYQTVLHAGRVHTNETVKETSSIASHDSHYVFPSSQTVSVPDSTNNAHNIGISFFEHPFIHPTNVMNGHMPIIIPTFPPN